MNKEEIYNKIINEETSKNVLLNEIYAIRDTRKETQDFTIYVDGCISVDALNSIIKLKNMYNKEYNEHMEMKRQNAILRNNEQILKEKLETQTQNYHLAMEDVNYFCDKYIPKQKIRDKIEELHKKRKYCSSDEMREYHHQIEVLEEILGE